MSLYPFAILPVSFAGTRLPKSRCSVFGAEFA